MRRAALPERAGAARNNNWDLAVTEYTKAVQEAPDKPEYKITLERAMQTAAQDHISRAREIEGKTRWMRRWPSTSGP